MGLWKLPFEMTQAPKKEHDDDLGMDYLQARFRLPNGRDVDVIQNQPESYRAKCDGVVSGDLDSGGLFAFFKSMMSRK